MYQLKVSSTKQANLEAEVQDKARSRSTRSSCLLKSLELHKKMAQAEKSCMKDTQRGRAVPKD